MSSFPLCRLCGADLTRTFVDLGMSPLCESDVPVGEGPALICGVHQAESVNDHVRLPAGSRRHEPASGQQAQPGPAMRAAVLGDHAVVRQESRRSDPFDGIGSLRDERSGLGAPRLLGHGGVGEQLGQAAR